MIKVNFYKRISLGHFCQSAQFIKDIGERVEAMPFDWCITNNYLF